MSALSAVGPVEPIIEFGAFEKVAELLESFPDGKVLVVTGERSFRASGLGERLMTQTQTENIAIWSKFGPNPNSAELKEGLAVLSRVRPALVVGLGGGSALDMAKLLVAFERIDPKNLEGAIRANAPEVSKATKLVLCPTLAGSGSEATHFAVVYINQEKFSVSSPGLYADAIYADPLTNLAVNPSQRATSAVDTMCQAVESIWARNSTQLSQDFARAALESLTTNIEEYVHRPSESLAMKFSRASYLAGRAIDISQTTAAHALSYRISQKYGIPHGNAVALTLGRFIDEHQQVASATGDEHLSRRVSLISQLLGLEAFGSGKVFVGTLLEKLGLIASLEDAGITGDRNIREIVNSVNLQRLRNNPVTFSNEDLIRILS